ncbi:toxin-antitoxin system protein [Coprococcus sp. B2-R-112]|uniref:toxin-antitoxin system protein n=1 Tax=Coprococcus sp. B2-R-112 TaxID=2949662 RepID=UPI00202DF3DF|nr:toxin-antitoxin system protein [Coprococcus sp. B2-R-112]MCM0663603.1 toxin-antitoxin system protein [Coprococcus sp. B2-R-112]
MKPLKNRYSLTLDEDVAEKIKEMAENDDRSFSQYINIILKEWIKNQEDGANK